MESKKPSLSVALAVYNEEANIGDCLRSIAGLADEIIVVDGGSTDQTVAIAQKFHAKVIKSDNPPIFHINKQKALNGCSGTWILQLDADEVVPEALIAEIRKTIRTSVCANGYFIPRKNFFLGHWLRKGGQYPDHVIRLVRNGKARFPAKNVHEQMHVEGIIGYLKEPLLHYSYPAIAHYWRKAHAYTTLTAAELKERRVSKNMKNYIRYEIVKPVQTFLSLYIRHKGFLDGVYGFLFALFSAFHYPMAYWKYLRGTV